MYQQIVKFFFFKSIFFVLLLLSFCNGNESTSLSDSSNKDKETAPVLEELSIEASTQNSITLAKPSFSELGNPLPTVYAYIGLASELSISNLEITNAIEADIDVYDKAYTFSDLTANTDYKIIVIAQNTSGFSTKEISHTTAIDNENQTNNQVPTNKAESLSFTDSDSNNGELEGTVSITKALDETDISHYVLYWGSDSETKLGTKITTIEKTGSNLTYTIVENTALPVGATHFLVYTKNDNGEMSTAISTPIVEYVLYPNPNWTTTTAEAHGLSSANLQAAATWAGNNGSESFIVIKDGSIIHEQYWNAFDANTKKDVASVTKSFTSILTGIIEDEGYLDIDELAYNYGTGWSGTDSENVKIVNLLGNNSGRYWEETADYITWMTKLLNDEDTTAYALGLGQQDDGGPVPVGTVFQYNNMAIQCLERVLTTALSGAGAGTLADFAQNNLLDLLGMSNTTYMFDTPGNMQMHAGIESTAQDLAKFGWLMLNKGNWNGTQVVSEAYITRAITPAIPSVNENYGLLFWLNSDTGNGNYYKELPLDAYIAIGLNGQIIIVSPSDNMVIIRQGEAGGSYNGQNTKHLINSLYRYVFDPKAKPALTSPTEGQTATGNTPTFTWADYSLTTPDEPWSYVLWLQAAGQSNPAVVWGLPNTTTSLDMTNLPVAKNKYDLFCRYTGGVWDGNSCSGGTPSSVDLSAFSDWTWKLLVVECDYNDFINDTPATSPADDYTSCAMSKIAGTDTVEYLFSETRTFTP